MTDRIYKNRVSVKSHPGEIHAEGGYEYSNRATQQTKWVSMKPRQGSYVTDKPGLSYRRRYPLAEPNEF